MNSLVAFLTALAMMLPVVMGQNEQAGPAVDVAKAAPETTREGSALGFDPAAAEPFRALEDARKEPEARQVRIEQRVIIRIAPSSPAARERFLSAMPRPATGGSVQERKLDGCVPITGIAAVEPAPRNNRLLLFMRDHKVLTASLDRTCKPEDFYAGFYVEPNEDGQLCARRDLLQSRAGASCEVAQLNRLVAVRE